ncbi:MAG TPA: DUF362 domain-containing protein [Spirochaetota bacterium]|nr:DUF362 domain-containing protein [Spirochaetota bacterium]HOM10192.1 DUF362 domain-containing protein [Spirochaetota bacterium]HPP48792.1 DUF362 domain-containing protein [Spirochaetota bacterium]
MKITRKNLFSSIISATGFLAGNYLTGLKKAFGLEKKTDLVVIKTNALTDKSIYGMVVKGFEEMGGIQKFVKKGSKVVIKPNMGFNSTPDRAHTTNPILVEAVAAMCKRAGANVAIMDRPVHNARLCYRSSGIEEVAKKVGVDYVYMDRAKFKTVKVPGGLNLDTLDVYEDILEADCIINMPIAKHHSAAQLTLAMKNLMGVIGGNRGYYHINLHRNIVDFNKAVKVHLIILDGLRILTKHGPSSGSPADIRETKTVIFGTNPVMVDAYAAKQLFGIEPSSIGYLNLAAQSGMGSINITAYSTITRTV